MDNPHYVTPEEAYVLGCCSDPQYHCNGPSCMAWRWERLSTESAMRDMNSAIEPQKRTSFLSNHSTTHGYCGMVRT